ncbi:MAG: acyl-CoA dehydrogenase family protein [Chloroflexi bacterium]|nr:acyl-CoA dehydrogenase family protein [Chloroflexota bacterium]
MNFYEADPNLAFLLRRLASTADYERAQPILRRAGALAGDELDRLAHLADKNPPVLERYDHRGDRVDEIVYHPAYHEMERLLYGELGLAGMSHRPGVNGWPTKYPFLVKYAIWYVVAQAEFGLLCPVNMTDTAARILGLFGSTTLQDTYIPHLTTQNLSELLTATQWMTERGGGSDVGNGTETIARRNGDVWQLYGRKWFCSNASADVIMTLARPEGAQAGTRGLAMFLLPKRLPDGASLRSGTRNSYYVERLKDKLGTRDMASGEVLLDGAVAFPIGPLDAGFRQMMEMVNMSRLSNAMRSAGMMRRSVLESVVHTRGRIAFGKPLFEQPLMRETLLGLLLDAEASAGLVLHTAAVIDRSEAGDAEARRLRRILIPLAKYWVTKRGRWVTGEGLEVRGGNGYIEDWVNARLVRDSHLGSIWEGSSNIIALDVTRSLLKDGTGEALFGDIERRIAAVQDADVRRLADRLAEIADQTRRRVAALLALEPERRDPLLGRLTERLAHLAAASVLVDDADFQATQGEGYRKLLLAAAYLRRYLAHADPLAPDDTAVRWLAELVDWAPIPAEAAHHVLSTEY